MQSHSIRLPSCRRAAAPGSFVLQRLTPISEGDASLSATIAQIRWAQQQHLQSQRRFQSSNTASRSRQQLPRHGTIPSRASTPMQPNRQLSLKSLSPTAMRIYALRLQVDSMPEDPEKHRALFSVLLETGSKDNAAEVVNYYEKHSGLLSKLGESANINLLRDQQAFDLYLAALAISNEGTAVSKLAEASQLRDAILVKSTGEPVAPTELPVTSSVLSKDSPSTASQPTLTDAQLANAVLSRVHPTSNVRVLNGVPSDSPISASNPPTASELPTSASPAAASMTGQIQGNEPTADATKARVDPASIGQTIPSASTSTSAAPGASLGSAGASSSSGSAGAAGRTGGNASEPIRVVVEEAKGNLFWRAVAWFGRTLFVTFLTLTLLSFLIDQTGIMRGASSRGGPKEFLPPASGKTYKFTDVHGCEEAKQELEEVVEFLKDPKKFTKLGGKLPRGVLLTGPPGTGKTLLARAVAGEADVKFLFASGSEFDEMYVGVGARRVRDLFAAAKANAPAIIFIDELDAVGGKRSPKNMQYQQQTLNELLVQLDGFTQTEGVILIGATNFPESLDKALIRPGRFDRHIVVPLPDVRGRLAILKHHLSDVTYDNKIDVSLLARGTPGFSGAELQNLVNHAAVHAARHGKLEVQAPDLEWAKDRVMLGSERRSAVITPEDKKLTAFHEAGHALVALMTEGSTPLHSVTCLPRGSSLGLTHFLPNMDVTNQTFTELQAHLDVAFGGRAAEEIVFGKSKITTGASSDISQATKIANSMVRHYGYSDVVGPVNVSDNDTIAPSTRSLVDQEVRRMLEEAKGRATEVLTSKKAELERLANALIEFETLNKDEVVKVINGERINKSIVA